MSKTKTLLFSILPLIIAIAVQFFAVYYLLFIGAVFLYGLGPFLTGQSYTMDDLLALASDMNFNTIAMIIFSFCCMVIFGIWYKKRCGGSFRINLKQDVHPFELLGIIFLIPGTQYLCSMVAAIVSTIFPSWMAAYEELLESAGLDANISTLMLVYSVLMAPISEELIFRGVIFRIAQRAFPFWIANVIQAALFGAFHMNPLQACYTFAVGLILGYVCHKGGSIYHVIFFHILFNLWGTIISPWMINLNTVLLTVIMLISLLLGLSLGFYYFNLGNKIKNRK